MFICNSRDLNALEKCRKQAQANAASTTIPWVIFQDTCGNWHVETLVPNFSGFIEVVYPLIHEKVRFTVEYDMTGQEFDRIDAAINWAKDRAKYAVMRPCAIPIWYSTDASYGRVIALVTDDANGITIHRLKTWPSDLMVEG